LKIVRRALFLCAVAAGLSAAAGAQTFGIGGAAGIVNDVDSDVEFSGFKWGDANGWFEYRMEKNTMLRLMYGSMWTQQSKSQDVVETPGGPVTLPELEENVRYGTVSVSYLFWEGFFTSGLFAGIGGYGMRPDPVPAGLEAYADRDETVFGWHAGVDGEFQVTKQVGVVLRFTYHNVSAHPHRQFVTADGGAVFRF
jgi:Outer membrane protein beta-barrel domain